MIHVSSGLSRAGRAEHTGNAYRQRQWIYATSPFGTSPGGPMSTSTLSRPQARRTTVLVVVGPAPGVPDWAARWAGRSGWTLQRRARGGPRGGGGWGGPRRRRAGGGPGEAPAAGAPGARALLLRPDSPVDRPAERRPHVVAALETLPDDDAVVADAVACAVAVGGALTFVHAVPRSFGERSVGLDGAVAH